MEVIERDRKKERLKVDISLEHYRLIFRALNYYERHMEAESKDTMAGSAYRGAKGHDAEIARIILNKM